MAFVEHTTLKESPHFEIGTEFISVKNLQEGDFRIGFLKHVFSEAGQYNRQLRYVFSAAEFNPEQGKFLLSLDSTTGRTKDFCFYGTGVLDSLLIGRKAKNPSDLIQRPDGPKKYPKGRSDPAYRQDLADYEKFMDLLENDPEQLLEFPIGILMKILFVGRKQIQNSQNLMSDFKVYSDPENIDLRIASRSDVQNRIKEVCEGIDLSAASLVSRKEGAN